MDKTAKTTSKPNIKKLVSRDGRKLESWERLVDGHIIDIRKIMLKKPPKEKPLRYEVMGGGERMKVNNRHTVVTKKGLTLAQEMFCQFYVINKETRFNATWSYAYAFGIDLEWADNEEIRDLTTRKVIKRSERKRLESICASTASVLLRNLKIQDRVTELLNSLKKDHIVDGEMMKLIIQDHDWDSKIAMIKEYNKLMKRITDKVEHSGSFTLAGWLLKALKVPQKEEK